jgi:hypothetical protein
VPGPPLRSLGGTVIWESCRCCDNDILNPSDIQRASAKLTTCPPGDAHSFVDVLTNDEVHGVAFYCVRSHSENRRGLLVSGENKELQRAGERGRGRTRAPTAGAGLRACPYTHALPSAHPAAARLLQGLAGSATKRTLSALTNKYGSWHEEAVSATGRRLEEWRGRRYKQAFRGCFFAGRKEPQQKTSTLSP